MEFRRVLFRSTGPISRKRDWREPRLDEETQIDFPPVVIAEMRRISEKLYERDPVAWFFQTIGALDMELDSRLRKEDDLVRTIQQDRKSVVKGKSVSVRVDLGGRRILTKKINNDTGPQCYNNTKETK